MTTPEPETSTEVQAAEPHRVLRRSRTDRVIAGVCGGLGRYLGIDPVLLRVAFVVLAVIGVGSGILLYVIAWLVIPEEGVGEETGAPPPHSAGTFRLLVGGGLVALGAILLADQIAPDWLDDRYVWPIVLILIGLAVLTRGARR